MGILFNILEDNFEKFQYIILMLSFLIDMILGATFLVGGFVGFNEESTFSFFNFIDTLRVSLIDISFLLCDIKLGK